MAEWICGKCGNEILTQGDHPPLLLPWSDGHKCRMIRLDTLDSVAQLRIIKHIEENL